MDSQKYAPDPASECHLGRRWQAPSQCHSGGIEVLQPTSSTLHAPTPNHRHKPLAHIDTVELTGTE